MEEKGKLKNRRIEIRISEREKAELEQTARLNGMTVSELITKAINLYLDFDSGRKQNEK